MAMVVAKILMGLGQVVSKQPHVVKQDFPGPQWCVNIHPQPCWAPFIRLSKTERRDTKLLHIFSVDMGWIAPICGVSYVSTFISEL